MAINLTPEQIADLENYGQQMGQIASEIERAERAGINVDDLKRRFVEVENLRAGLLREYGPPQVTQTRRKRTS